MLRICCAASVVDASTKWVAPNCLARCSFSATVSTAMIRLAFESLSPWITFSPTPADSEDGRGVTRLDLRTVEHRADPGEHAAADEARGRERDLGRDLDGLNLGHDSPLHEHRSRREVGRRLARELERRGHVAEAADAPCRMPRRARPAPPAIGEGRHDDVVAGLDARHTGPHRLDDAGTLVAENGGRLPWDRPVDHRQVRVADPGRLDGDEHLTASRIPHRQLVCDLGIAAGENDASHLCFYLLSGPGSDGSSLAPAS